MKYIHIFLIGTVFLQCSEQSTAVDNDMLIEARIEFQKRYYNTAHLCAYEKRSECEKLKEELNSWVANQYFDTKEKSLLRELVDTIKKQEQ